MRGSIQTPEGSVGSLERRAARALAWERCGEEHEWAAVKVQCIMITLGLRIEKI